jgi:predicted metallopeptidase
MHKNSVFLNRNKIVWSTVCYILFFVVIGSNTSQATQNKSIKFKVYNSTLYENAPDMRTYHIDKIQIVYSNAIWIDGLSYDKPITDEILKESVKRISKKLNDDIKIICLDIEHWPLTASKEIVNKSKEKYIDIVRRFKKLMPDKMIGLYGVIPIRNYYDSLKIGSTGYNKWTKQINDIAEIANEVDIFFPSLYTFNSNKSDWAKYAEANINQAKRFNKPVIPLIWPQYHESNRILGLRYLSDDYWKFQLEVVAKHADGVLIWGGWDIKRKKRQKWNEDAPWWKALLEFVKTIK